jgi:hypothetical protein
MPTCKFFGNACRAAILTALMFCASNVDSCRGQDQEELPGAVVDDRTLQEKTCNIVDRPLADLSVDINPLNAEGQPVEQDNLPTGCAQARSNEAVPFFISYGPGCWDCHDILQLARFCHPRVYFEDVMMERYGVEPVFPCLHSAAEFTCDLVLLPGQLLVHKRHPCVRTPTPHCWSGCSVCGF